MEKLPTMSLVACLRALCLAPYFLTFVTEFWKITLMGAPETIRVYHTLDDITKTFFKCFYIFPWNSNIYEQKTKFSSCFSELNI